MRTTTTFPRPNIWQPPSPWILGPACVFGVALGVGLTIGGLVDAGRGDVLRALFLVACGLAALGVVVAGLVGIVVAGSDDLRFARIVSTGGTLRVSMATEEGVAVVGSLVAMTAAGGLFLLGAWFDCFEIPLSSREQTRLGPLFAAGAVSSAARLLRLVYAGRLGGVELSPTGVRTFGWVRSTVLPWDLIASITAADPTSRKRPRSGTLFLRLSDGSTRILKVNDLSIGSGAAYWLLKFYLAHPGCRDELADGRAEDHLRSGGDPIVVAYGG